MDAHFIRLDCFLFSCGLTLYFPMLTNLDNSAVLPVFLTPKTKPVYLNLMFFAA